MERAFSPQSFSLTPWGVAPGWQVTGPLALSPLRLQSEGQALSVAAVADSADGESEQETAAVTDAPVRCSAWLGVAVILGVFSPPCAGPYRRVLSMS